MGTTHTGKCDTGGPHVSRLVARSEAPAGQDPAATRALEEAEPTAIGSVAGEPEIRSLPSLADPSQPPLARGAHARTHNTAPAPARSSCKQRTTPHQRYLIAHSFSLSRFLLCLLSYQLSPSPLLSLRESAIPFSRYILSLVDASTRFVYPPSRPICNNAMAQGGMQEMREEAGVRSLSPSTTPDAGPRPREGKGVGMIASTDRDGPALRNRRLSNTTHHIYTRDGRSGAFSERKCPDNGRLSLLSAFT